MLRKFRASGLSASVQAAKILGMIGQRLATAIARGRPDLRGRRYGRPRQYGFSGAPAALGEQQVKASPACIAADQVHFALHEHFKFVNFGRATVWAVEVEAGCFRGFVKVHRHLALTEKAHESGSERRRYSALESRCPESNCITALPALLA